jgi:hypothetical protein
MLNDAIVGGGEPVVFQAGYMYCVSVNLTSAKWLRIQDAAGKQWPNEVLPRAEIVRRYTLAGVDILKHLSAADRARVAHSFQA